jgi:putative SOS response-associated peptidase YedK
MATFNARAETVETKPVFRDAFKRTRCLIPMSGYYEWQNTASSKQPWYFTARDGSADSHGGRALGRMEKPRDRRAP